MKVVYGSCSLLLVLTLSGCGNSDVALVKDGAMTGYEKTTVGKAFEASFDDTLICVEFTV
jgi:hypothetical protein